MKVGLRLTFIGLLVANSALAGARIELRRGQKEVLPASRVKSLIAEFVDEERTGLGEEVATVLGGELLDAVADVPGAGVIVATGEGGGDLVERLGRDYHDAALAIAGEQRAMLVAWGILEDAGAGVRLESYVTQVPDSALGIRLQAEWEGRAIQGFGAAIPARAFHFAPRIVARRDLFRRRLVLLGERGVFRDPDASNPRLATLASGTRVTADTLVGRWWHVRGPQGSGWIQDDPNLVKLPPRAVVGRGEKVEVSKAPGGPSSSRKLTGRFVVMDATYGEGGRWLRIAPADAGAMEAPETLGAAPVVTAAPVWIRARSVAAVYSLPFIHFVAGLYRYRLDRPAEAARDFQWALDHALAPAARAQSGTDGRVVIVANAIAALDTSFQIAGRDPSVPDSVRRKYQAQLRRLRGRTPSQLVAPGRGGHPLIGGDLTDPKSPAAWMRDLMSWQSTWLFPVLDNAVSAERHNLIEDAIDDYRHLDLAAALGEDNATLAAMNQHLGISRLEARPDDEQGLRDLDRAVALTPYDARAFSVRALARVSVKGVVEDQSLEDIDTALMLDPGDRVARDLVFGMKDLLASPEALDKSGPVGRSLRSKHDQIARLHSVTAAIKDTVRAKY